MFHLLALVCLVCGSGWAATPSPELAPSLTEAERAWLAGRDSVRVAYDGHFPPYSLRNDTGHFEGFSVDMFGLLAQRTGLTFEPWEAGDTWAVLYEAAKNKRVDVVATMVDRPERHAWFSFTEPYIAKSLVVMTRATDGRIREKQNLAGKRVALVRDYQYSQRVVDEFPSVEPLYVDTMVDALNAVSTNKADAAITFHGGGHYLRTRYMMTNLQFAAVYDRNTSHERVAVRGDWPELASILDKALATIGAAERLELEERWLPTEPIERSEHVALTEAEQAWVQAHPVIRVGVDPEFHPYEFVDKTGAYRGMAADFVSLLNDRTGLNLEVVPGLSWKQVIAKARDGEIDVLPAVGMTEERKTFLLFTQPYVRFHRVIITRVDAPFVTGIDDLRTMRVAVQANSSHDGYLADGTGIEPHARHPTLQKAILSVANGESDALVGNLASSAYWIRKLTVSNLKVAGTPSNETHGLHFAVRKDWPELVGILQKGLASITPEERQAIKQKWVVLKFDPETDYGPLMRVSGVAAGLLLLSGAWILRARRHALELDAERDRVERLVEERTAELRASEEAFRRAQKMEALGTLVGGIAHDFNNLLTGLLGSLFLARNSADADEVEEHLDASEVLCMRGAGLIDQLLAFARHEGLQKEEVDLDQLVTEAHRLVNAAVPSNIVFTVEPSGIDPWVLGSPALLQQAVFNLVINARDALEGADDPRIVLTVEVLDDAARITVRDNGSGIDPDTIDRLFDPFFTTKAPGKGTGLGLAMVFGTARDHGGTIEVASEPGQGTRFHLTLPTIDPPEPSVVPEPTFADTGLGQRVLLADDDPALREINQELLTYLGYECEVAADGQEAVDKVQAAPGKFDLCLLDGVMPRLTGQAAARRIKALNPDIRVVLLTGYGTQTGPFPDVDIVISKPITIQNLARTLSEQLDRGNP